MFAFSAPAANAPAGAAIFTEKRLMSDLQHVQPAAPLRDSLEAAYAQESQERKRVREKNWEQIHTALAGGEDPFGQPVCPRRK